MFGINMIEKKSYIYLESMRYIDQKWLLRGIFTLHCIYIFCVK